MRIAAGEPAIPPSVLEQRCRASRVDINIRDREMANNNKQTKAAPAPKAETAAKDKSASGESAPKPQSAEGASKTESSKTESSKTESSKTESSKTESSKTESSKSDAAPANYSRGEGQKPVTEAYRENWNLIFANKNSRRKKR
jgi:hypothetical protein